MTTTGYEAMYGHPVTRVSAHRPAPIQLPDDPQEATAAVVALIQGDDQMDRAAAIEALTVRATALASADPEEAIQALAEHLVPLHNLFLLFASESVQTKNIEAKTKFLKLALSAQNSYCRTQTLVIGLREQSKGRARVVLNESQEGES